MMLSASSSSSSSCILSSSKSSASISPKPIKSTLYADEAKDTPEKEDVEAEWNKDDRGRMADSEDMVDSGGGESANVCRSGAGESRCEGGRSGATIADTSREYEDDSKGSCGSQPARGGDGVGLLLQLLDEEGIVSRSWAVWWRGVCVTVERTRKLTAPPTVLSTAPVPGQLPKLGR